MEIQEKSIKPYNNALVEYPPAPWCLKGKMWVGFYKMDKPVKLPGGFKHVFSPYRQIVLMVKYMKGSVLEYDEFALGSFVRYGLRHWGIYVNHIWVNNAESMWGGRFLWGLPKEMAQFSWSENKVRITTEDGLLAEILLEDKKSGLRQQQIPAIGFGILDDAILYSSEPIRANVGRTTMTLLNFGKIVPYRPVKPVSNGFALHSFEINLPAPVVLNTQPKQA